MFLGGDGVDILRQTAPTKAKFLKLTLWFVWVWKTFGLVRKVRTVPNHSARMENNHRQGRPRPAGNSCNLLCSTLWIPIWHQNQHGKKEKSRRNYKSKTNQPNEFDKTDKSWITWDAQTTSAVGRVKAGDLVTLGFSRLPFSASFCVFRLTIDDFPGEVSLLEITISLSTFSAKLLPSWSIVLQIKRFFWLVFSERYTDPNDFSQWNWVTNPNEQTQSQKMASRKKQKAYEAVTVGEGEATELLLDHAIFWLIEFFF